jgi:hypothetical protein
MVIRQSFLRVRWRRDMIAGIDEIRQAAVGEWAWFVRGAGQGA